MRPTAARTTSALLAAITMGGCAVNVNSPYAGGPSAPGLMEITLSPTDATTVDDLALFILQEANDPDGDLAGHRVTWLLNGAPLPAFDDAETIPASETTRGDHWEVRVVPFDDEGLEGPTATAEVEVRNTLPTAAVGLEPSEPITTDPLSLTVATADADEDAVTFTVNWTLDGNPSASHDDFTIIPAADTEKGQRWTFSVTPDDGQEPGAVQMGTVDVINALPEVEGVLLTPEAPRAGDTLFASGTATDADLDETTLAFAWFIDGVRLADQGADTLAPDQLQKGQQIHVVLTADDGTSEGNPASSQPVTVLNTPPTAPAVNVTPDAPQEAEDLQCSIATSGAAQDADGDPVVYDIVWLQDEVVTTWAAAGAIADSIVAVPASATAAGEAWRCEATPFDGEEAGAPGTSEVLVQADPWDAGVASFGFEAGFVFDANTDSVIEWTPGPAASANPDAGPPFPNGPPTPIRPYLLMTFGNDAANWNNPDPADFCTVVYEWTAPIGRADWAEAEGAYFGFDLEMETAIRDDSDCSAADPTGGFVGYANLMSGVWKVSVLPLTAEMATTLEQAGPPTTTSALSATMEYEIEGMPELDSVWALGTALTPSGTDFATDASGQPVLIPATEVDTEGLVTGFYRLFILNVIGLG